MRSFLYCSTAIALVLVMLVGCTRNRPTPESSDTEGVVNTAGENAPVLVTPALGEITSTVASAAEPQVATTTPEAAGGAAASSASDTVAAPAGGEAASTGSQSIQYTVQDGDSLLSIAAQFGTDVASLRQLNFLVDDDIQTGQVLRVPLGEGYTAAGAPTATPAPYLYTVQPGDTLYGIAIQFDVDATDIIQANGLLDQNSVLVGSNLIIPGYQPAAGTSGGAAAAGDATTNQVAYVVEPGDTLYSIAEVYGVDAASIAAANGIQNLELLRVGQQIFIPGITPAEAAAINQVVHVVQPGEGLLGIAVQYGVSAEEIAQLNNLQNTDIIYPGQNLIIPGN